MSLLRSRPFRLGGEGKRADTVTPDVNGFPNLLDIDLDQMPLMFA